MTKNHVNKRKLQKCFLALCLESKWKINLVCFQCRSIRFYCSTSLSTDWSIWPPIHPLSSSSRNRNAPELLGTVERPISGGICRTGDPLTRTGCICCSGTTWVLRSDRTSDSGRTYVRPGTFQNRTSLQNWSNAKTPKYTLEVQLPQWSQWRFSGLVQRSQSLQNRYPSATGRVSRFKGTLVKMRTGEPCFRPFGPFKKEYRQCFYY